jgi:CelD/BcsL family acetyltransferase involved in cellulose biosynthesis
MLDVAVPFKTKTAVPVLPWDVREVAKSKVNTPAVHCFEPLKDARWDAFVEQHPQASVFHTSAWLEALRRTYGYQPVAYTTSAPTGALENAVVFCRVDSWLTGCRLVSLPFSDHCEPLIEAEDAPAVMAEVVSRELERSRARYIELRPLVPIPLGKQFRSAEISYAFHKLDLRPDSSTLFRNFHESSIQRKIRRSEREGLTCREGCDEGLLDTFYKLFEMNRRRHRVPPQPREWFINLVKCFGADLKIRVASKGDQAVAAMITLRSKDTLVYKYGCSDPRFNNLGSMPFLYWQAIREAKSAGLSFFDLGRTDADQQGLITFKNRWGATQSVLTYVRYGVVGNSSHYFDLYATNWKPRAAKYVLSKLPAGVFSTIGRILYRHVG